MNNSNDATDHCIDAIDNGTNAMDNCNDATNDCTDAIDHVNYASGNGNDAIELGIDPSEIWTSTWTSEIDTDPISRGYALPDDSSDADAAPTP